MGSKSRKSEVKLPKSNPVLRRSSFFPKIGVFYGHILSFLAFLGMIASFLSNPRDGTYEQTAK